MTWGIIDHGQHPLSGTLLSREATQRTGTVRTLIASGALTAIVVNESAIGYCAESRVIVQDSEIFGMIQLTEEIAHQSVRKNICGDDPADSYFGGGDGENVNSARLIGRSVGYGSIRREATQMQVSLGVTRRERQIAEHAQE